MNVKRFGAIAMTAAVVLGLTGCIRITSDITLHEDNTVSGEMVIAVQEGVGDAMGMTDEEFAESLNEDNGTGSLTNATVTEYSEDGYIGSRITFKDQPLESFEGVDGTLTRDGDTFVFEGTAPDSSDTAGLPEGSGAIASMSITFPGKVSKHNGTLEGKTVTWDLLTLTEAPYATGSAIGGGGGGSSPIVLIVGGLVLLAAVVVGVVLARRKSGASPTEEAPPAVDPAP